MPTQRLTKEIITAAIEGYEAQQKKIEAQIAELRGFLNDGSVEASPTEGTGRRRGRFSDATKLRMKQAQQRRWARIRGESGTLAPATAALKPKRQLSAAGREAIAQAARKRWAANKASKETPESSVPKKSGRKAATKKAAAK